MHYFLKPLLRAMRKMDDSELKLAIIGGMLFSIGGLLDLLGWWRIM
jgi:Kef-type K+ transport system membrane component KefB